MKMCLIPYLSLFEQLSFQERDISSLSLTSLPLKRGYFLGLLESLGGMEVFAQNGDIYCASASQMFKVPVEKNGQNSHLRQKGKISELALGYNGSVGALKAMGSFRFGFVRG